ncbi:Abhydrolase-3 domain-containing protein [Mycena indigotica]|uniref:Abhydrolase-3 domain-containing protein n=1 Tax=Mycena indigotica TaxID=2126181 RepID=A0A8H6SD49_9AGAR|nr:Abhydrolase-3 domain-containing protein [Mycena indigotica]KAF7297244.1 Abhydrolase-3 domain-containing protein [Mycena indigotica]
MRHSSESLRYTHPYIKWRDRPREICFFFPLAEERYKVTPSNGHIQAFPFPMALQDKSQYGKLSLTQRLGLVGSLLSMPVKVLWSVLTTSHASYNKDRTLKRIIGDTVLRNLTSLSTPQLQMLFGTDQQIYATFTKSYKLPSTVDELGDDAKLYWIGPKRTERVMLFLHGGAFLLPAADFSLRFWRYVQVELEKKGVEVGFAYLEYTLAPYAAFPTPLKQASLAVNFLLDAGVKPSNLQIAGDSAGGNLAIQLISHILHPLPSVPRISLSSPIRGVYLISPWTSLSASSPSHKFNDGLDFLTFPTLSSWGAQILEGFPTEHRVFAEAITAPADWFAGAEGVFQRVLVTAGGAELLKDDIVAFHEVFKKHHSQTELVVQPNGLHEDMFLDFMLGEEKVGSLTPLTVEWLAAGFS